MASKTRPAKAGYNPAAGRPEPGDPRDDGQWTHSPHRNGTVCGLPISDASAYTVEAPTCPECLRHFTAVQRSAARLNQRAEADAKAKATAAAAATLPPKP